MIEFETGEIIMKTIYTFSLESDDYPSDSFDNKLRLIAHLLYDYLYNYTDENDTPLVINDNIEYNRINETSCFQYKLDSDLYDDGCIYYEPFLVEAKTFCLTVFDNKINFSEIQNMVQYVIELLGLNYKVTINSVSYQAKNLDDESNRYNAIRLIYEKLSCRFTRKNGVITKIKNSKFNRNRKKIRKNYCN